MELLTSIFAEFIWTAAIWRIVFIYFLVHLFRRTDISSGTKVTWTLLLFLFPFIGVLVYALVNFKKSKLLFFVGILAIVALGINAYLVYNKPHRDVTKEEGIVITAQKIYDDFKANEADGNKKYLNKAVQLNGEVSDVSVNQDSSVVVNFKTSDPIFVINCTFKTNPGTLKAGDKITFKGICTGYIPDNDVVINEGVLVK